MTAAGAGNALLDAALAYAGRGWAVFPCHRDKTPATAHGVKDATTDPAQIRRWWGARPAASIGLACGPSGLVVIDVDVVKGGYGAWKALKAAHGIDDETLTSITGGGGWHLVYRAPADFRGKNSAGKLGPGLDVRANGGYIIAPPSGHPSGKTYMWDPACPDAEPIPLPDNLRALLERPEGVPAPPTPAAAAPGAAGGAPEHGHAPAHAAVHAPAYAPAYAAAALRAELDSLSRAGEGTRNDSLNRAAFSLGQLVGGGELDRAGVERELLAAARRIGLGEREASASIKSGLDAGAREPRTAPAPPSQPPARYVPVPDEPPPWLDENGAPVDAPPPWLDEIGAPADAPPLPPARSAATSQPDLSECPPLPESAQLDPALGRDASPWLDAYIEYSRKWAPGAYDGFHESVGLWVLSTVAARRSMLDFGGERYPSLYIANIARSSLYTKSTAHHIGSDLLGACGLSFLLAPDDATPQALLFRMSVPPIITDWDAKPIYEQERMRQALAFAGQKGWDYDEFGSKVSAMMRDSGTMADFRGILRRLDDASPQYTYVTVGRGENRIQRPYLALLASMPPANMAPYAKRGGALWHDGFWARFAFVAPGRDAQPPMGEFPEGKRTMPSNLTTPLRAWHDRLGLPQVDLMQRKDTDGKPARDFDVIVTPRPPEVCTLGTGVRDAFYRYYSGLRGLAAASDNSDLDANYSRFAEKALRVAILLASLENMGRIELCHWARAQAITERWRQNLHNLYVEINAGQNEEAQNEDRLLAIVRKLKLATPNEVYRYAPELSISETATILERLERAGALNIAEITPKKTPRYRVNES